MAKFYAFSLPFAQENHTCNMKLMKKRFARLGISKNSSSEPPTSYFFVEMLRNICFEMRIKCGGNLKVLVPFRAFGKTLTLSDVLNAHQIMERFIRLGIGTFSYCVGANGPRLFIFSGASP